MKAVEMAISMFDKVTEGVDEGPIIIQAAVPILEGDTPEALAESALRFLRDTEARAAIDAIWRIEAPRLIGALTRFVRDLDRAEDLAQDAFDRRIRRAASLQLVKLPLQALPQKRVPIQRL